MDYIQDLRGRGCKVLWGFGKLCRRVELVKNSIFLDSGIARSIHGGRGKVFMTFEVLSDSLDGTCCWSCTGLHSRLVRQSEFSHWGACVSQRLKVTIMLLRRYSQDCAAIDEVVTLGTLKDHLSLGV